MPSSIIANVHNSASAFADQANLFIIHNVHSPLSSSVFGRNTLPTLTTDSMNLTRQIGTVFNPLTQPVYQTIPQVQNQQLLRLIKPMVQRPQPVPQPQPVEPIIQGQPEVVLLDRNHDANEVVRNVQQQDM